MKTVKEIKKWIDTKESRDEAKLKMLVGKIIDRDWKKFKCENATHLPAYAKEYSLWTILIDKLFRYLAKLKKQQPVLWRMETLYDNHIVVIELESSIDWAELIPLQKYIIRITNNKRTTRKNAKKEY